MTTYLGLDIGGANLKAAAVDDKGNFIAGREVPFPFWTSAGQLNVALTQLAASLQLESPLRVGVTMTAELADCFVSKQVGVNFIVDTVEQIFADEHPRYYQTTGQLVVAEVAKQKWRLTAASNWHASASYLFRQSESRSGFLIDLGSTTCDVIPVRNGSPVVSRQTDLDRLQNRQLLYVGCGRTPVCSIVEKLKVDDIHTPIARELFATVADARIWLGELDESESTETADGQPANRTGAGRRLARMVCADLEDLEQQTIDDMARQIRLNVIHRVRRQVDLVVNQYPRLPATFILAGSGHQWARLAVEGVFKHRDDQPILETELVNSEQAQLVPALACAVFRKARSLLN